MHCLGDISDERNGDSDRQIIALGSEHLSSTILMTTGNYIADVVGMRKLGPITSKYTPGQSSMRVFAQLLINECSSINNGNSAKSQWINSVFKKSYAKLWGRNSSVF